MKYLTILDYTTGSVLIIKDPNIKSNPDFDYDDYILKEYGKMDYHYIIHNNLEINL